MVKKSIYICILIIVLIFIRGIFIDKDDITTRVINYDNNKLSISIDGISSSTLPTTGTYYLVNYDCNNIGTKVIWNNSTYDLIISNATNKGEVACYLEFKAKPLLSEMEPGSYVKYTGTNGCEGKQCEGYNANYVSDTDMGYCKTFNPQNVDFNFHVNGWRIGYIEDGSAYLVSAGAPECICTGSNGVSSNSKCSGTSLLYMHANNMNNTSLKYCNKNYANDGICDENTVWALSDDSISKIVEHVSCSTRKKQDGYLCDLIDVGGYYWFTSSKRNPNGTTSGWWFPGDRILTHYYFTTLAGVRPVLYLDSSVIVTGGSGTYQDPYLIANNSFLINSGSRYIGLNNDLSAISLTMNKAIDVSTMCVSVDSSVCTNYIAYSDTHTIDMSSYNEGEHIIYVYYKDSSDNIVASIDRSVVIDITAPTDNSIAISGGTTVDRTLTLSSVGAGYMCFSNTSNSASDCTDWVDYATTYNWTLEAGDGEKTVYVFFKDAAGNISNAVFATTTVS